MQELASLREELADRLGKTLGYYHTLGYSNAIWPSEAVMLIREASFRHSELVRGMDELYAIGSQGAEEQQAMLSRVIEATYLEWLEKAWVHKPEGKDAIVTLIQYVVAHNEGKVYLAQLPQMLYLVCYHALILQGRSLTDLVWHVEQPHPNSIQVASHQIPMIMQLIEESVTVSTPPLRSSYLTHREKAKKIAKHLDGILGSGTSDLVKSILVDCKGIDPAETLPVALWKRGYRPEGDRLMLEQCWMWDEKGRFSNVTTAMPMELLSLKSDGVM